MAEPMAWSGGTRESEADLVPTSNYDNPLRVVRPNHWPSCGDPMYRTKRDDNSGLNKHLPYPLRLQIDRRHFLSGPLSGTYRSPGSVNTREGYICVSSGSEIRDKVS